MKLNFKKSIALGICFALLAVAFVSCKKNKNDEPSGSRKELTLDSIFLYAKQVYYWNDALPSYDAFNPRQYNSGSTDLDSYNSALFAISQLKINPLTNRPYEYYASGVAKYSRIDDNTEANPSATSSMGLADVDTEGNGNDIGIRPIFYLTTKYETGPYLLFITAVYQNSPAEALGVKRGWVITKVNNKSIGTNYTTEQNTVRSALAAGSVTLTGYNFIDNEPFNVTLTKTSYKSSPVYADKVFTISNKKIGYLSLARFSILSNPSSNAPSDKNLDPVFANFSAQGITDLIVDLRYNGGGYVNTAEYLANLIAPSSLAGKKMYTEIYNSTMQAGNAKILSNQPLPDPKGKLQYADGKLVTYADVDYSLTAESNNANFVKKGSLNTIMNLVFIVSGNTASASELLINVLKPYLNVKLVGETTYGKPVGFFPIKIENRYEIYMSTFETRNSNNEGGYYSGMTPNVEDDFDDPTHVFGDEKENYLSLALNLLVPGFQTTSADRIVRVDGTVVEMPKFDASHMKAVNPNSEFKGMIETRHTIK